MKTEKAVSPVVATVLLIMIVIIIALIIIFWLRAFFKEAVMKEIAGDNRNIQQFCPEIRIESIINSEDGSFGFKNIGNIPIYEFKVKLDGGGNSRIIKIDSKNGGEVNPGFNVMLTGRSSIGSYTDYDSIKLIPVLLGKTQGGLSTFECPETYAIRLYEK